MSLAVYEYSDIFIEKRQYFLSLVYFAHLLGVISLEFHQDVWRERREFRIGQRPALAGWRWI